MARRKREIPTYFSIEVGVVRGIAESMDDYQWSKWSKKALDDLSIGCIRKDTDPRVREVFEKSKSEMDAEYQRKKEWYENKKASREECLSTATGNDQVPADEQRTGGHKLPSSSRSPVRNDVDVLSLAYGGEFQNVKLTQEQYNQLGIRFGNLAELNRAIDSLSCKLENEEIKPVPKNHYAVLLKWASYRDDMDEKEELKASSAQHYETVSEHNRRVLENGRKWIDEHFPKKESANG